MLSVFLETNYPNVASAVVSLPKHLDKCFCIFVNLSVLEDYVILISQEISSFLMFSTYVFITMIEQAAVPLMSEGQKFFYFSIHSHSVKY